MLQMNNTTWVRCDYTEGHFSTICQQYQPNADFSLGCNSLVQDNSLSQIEHKSTFSISKFRIGLG